MMFSSKPMKNAIALIGVMTVVVMMSERTYAQAGGSAVPFLLIAPNARADGMGESGGGLADDASASYWNPAGLAFLKGQEVSLTHSNWLPQFQQSDLFYEYLTYRNHIAEWGGTISASIVYLNLGEFNQRDDANNDLGNFKAYEFAVTGGYATTVTDELGIGLNLRFIRSALAPFNVQDQNREGVANTVSFDIATMWKPSALENRLSVGLNLSNLGPKVTYIDAQQADPLPTNLRLGIGYKAVESEFNNLSLALDFNRLLIRRYASTTDTASNTQSVQPPDDLPKALFSSWGDGGLSRVTIATGFEYWYGNPRLVAIRAGYFYESPENGGRRFLTYGAGIRYDVYGFDFSYLSTVEQDHPLGETLRFTLSIAWGGKE